MKIKPTQLKTNLAQGLAPAYLISGDEPLLVQQSTDSIRQACRKQGFGDREVYHIEDKHAPWEDVLASAASLSLFADKKLIELRCKTNKIGDAGSKAILQYLQNPSPDVVWLIIMPKLEAAQNRSKWCKAIESKGVSCPIWPIEHAQLPRWIEQGLSEHNISASPEALAFLAENVEGNLLAAQQEIDKLALLKPGENLDLETMANVISNSSRYSIFDLSDRILSADKPAALKTLQGLLQENTAETLIVWTLAKDLRLLYRLHNALENGLDINTAMKKEFVFFKRQALVKQALQRFSKRQISVALHRLQQIDKTIKGLGDTPSNILLERFILQQT